MCWHSCCCLAMDFDLWLQQPMQAPWDDLELGRLVRDDACGRTYRATFQGACVTAKARAQSMQHV